MTRMKYNLSGDRQESQKNYIAATRRMIWRPPEKFSGCCNMIIWRSPYNSCDGRQISHLVAARSISFVSPTGFRTKIAYLTKIPTFLNLSIINYLPSTSTKNYVIKFAKFGEDVSSMTSLYTLFLCNISKYAYIHCS